VRVTQLVGASVILALSAGAGAEPALARKPPPRSTSNSIILGEDRENPGAGVRVTETRTTPGKAGHPGTGRPAAATGGHGGAPSGERCAVFDAPLALTWWGNSVDPDKRTTAGPLKPGATYYTACHMPDGSASGMGQFTYRPAAPAAAAVAPQPPDVEAIARQVYSEIPLVAPTPHTAPPVDAEQLVGFPVWFWIDGGAWRTFDAHAGVAGVSVTVVAKPKQVVWELGDGTTLDCHGPGTAWNPGAGRGQHSDCTHIYQHVSAGQPGGRYAASVSVVWSVSWSASTGQSGTLPDASRTSGFSLLVTQRQAVIHYGN
jgi:hypothetical protein